MKRIFLPVVFALMLSGGFVLAQTTDPAPAAVPQGQTEGQGHHRAANPHREAMRLSKKLNLSADQTAKLEPILADRDQKMTALKANTAVSPQDRKAQARTIFQDSKQQIDGVLTPEQVQQMKTMRRGRGGQGQPAAAPAAPSGV